MDDSPLNLQQVIAELSHDDHDSLLEIVKLSRGTDMEILHTVPKNAMPQKPGTT